MLERLSLSQQHLTATEILKLKAKLGSRDVVLTPTANRQSFQPGTNPDPLSPKNVHSHLVEQAGQTGPGTLLALLRNSPIDERNSIKADVENSTEDFVFLVEKQLSTAVKLEPAQNSSEHQKMEIAEAVLQEFRQTHAGTFKASLSSKSSQMKEGRV
jgi:hypothetical protein